MKPAISVENLGKCYRVSHQRAGARDYRTLRESLTALATAPLRRLREGANGAADASEDFWALQDVSFDVKPGEVVGIIGRNGAGKSTLLKILSRITKPSKGQVAIHGRVGSLLEVGTGFHPELTGRENIYLNGSILGMSRTEIGRRFDEIVAFSEIEKFLDTPVKRYSSGMYVRLAFAVAAHLEPEILVVDEVLAVGDAQFQQKCLGKISEVARTGRTVLFVSHDLHAITRLTTRCVLLDRGAIAHIGPTSSVIDHYFGTHGATEAEWTSSKRGDKPARIVSIRALSAKGNPSSRFRADEPFQIELTCEFRDKADAQLAFRLNNNRNAETVLTTALSDQLGSRTTSFSVGTFVARCDIPAPMLRPGHYHVLAALNNFRGGQYDLVEKALTLEISEVGSPCGLDQRVGVVTPILSWSMSASTS